MITTYKTITTPTQAEFKDKGSRFIAYVYPIRTLADVKKYLDPLKEEHHKARHWCYAYDWVWMECSFAQMMMENRPEALAALF